jgi:hypothetical protein
MIEIVLALAFAVPAILCIRTILAFRRGQLDRMQMHRQEFYRLASELIKNDRLNDEYLNHIKVLAVNISDPNQIGFIIAACNMIESQFRAGTFSPPSGTIDPAWPVLVYNYLFAVTYLRFWKGASARSALIQLCNPQISIQTTEAIDRRILCGELQAA